MNSELARRQMVEQQVRVWDVTDTAVLETLGEVERERFLPAGFADVAYADTEIPLGHGQVMLRPVIEGRLLQALAPRPTDRALDVGTGSGYLAACLSRLCREVSSIDLFDKFVGDATERLARAGIRNVEASCMDATAELPAGEFDVIAVSSSMPHVDERLPRALGDGGRLFVVEGTPPVMNALLITRRGDEWQRQSLFETSIPPLLNLPEEPVFSF